MLKAAAAAATLSGADELWADTPPVRRSANERLGVAVIGVRGRGNSHLGFFAAQRDTRVLYVCDVDRAVGPLRARQVARRQRGCRPLWVEDLRVALDDPRVDIVSIATPNHWHALAALWAMQAGKDVYVEKPVSHHLLEGRRMVEAARQYRRICQSGFQARSNQGMIQAMQFLQTGGIGTVRLAHGRCHQRRRDAITDGAYSAPAHVNYDLWLGPAASEPLTRQRFHYDWRWQWDYGNGDLGDQALHQLDICRWGLQLKSIGGLALSCAAQSMTGEAKDRFSRQVSFHQLDDRAIVMEIGQFARQPKRVMQSGVIFEGTDGYLVTTSHHSGTAFDRDGEIVRHFRGGGGSQPHLLNFLDAVRTGSCATLNADIEEGHLSGALAHTGNISFRLGNQLVDPTATRDQWRAFPSRWKRWSAIISSGKW